VGVATSYALTVFAELFCTLFLVIGLFTRAALIPLIILMLVIVFDIHGDEPFADREHGLMYLLLYIALLFTGPGNYSLDRLIQKLRKQS
jgi:putative oxidoreductase